MHTTIVVRMVVLTLALAVGPLAQLAPSYAQTQGSERRQDRRDDRQDARDTRQTGREDGRDAKAECKAGDENCSLYKEGRSKQTRTNILLGVTGVFAVATGVLAAIVDWGPPTLPLADQAKGPRVTPWLAWSNGPNVGARGSF